MSVSSGSSVCGDIDDLLLDEEDEVDFYSILNVPRDATDEEITKAYRKRCLIFHPDRHTDENDKKDAEKIFVQLRRAHDTLMDPKQRAIYDALGVQGLDTQGWELVTRGAQPDDIRREYEFLQRLRHNEIMIQKIHPTSSFVVKTSLAGMFYPWEEDRLGPQFLGLAMNQSIECPMTQRDKLGLVGRIKTGNGRGDGNMSVVWKKSTDIAQLDSTLTLSSDTVQLSCRAARNIMRAAIIAQPSLIYHPLQNEFSYGMALIYSMRLRLRWQGSLVLNMSPQGGAFTTSIVHTDKNQPKAILNVTLSPASPNVRGVYICRSPDGDSFIETSCTVSPFGFAPGVNAETKLGRYSRVGCALNFAYPSCMLSAKLKLKMAQSSYEWHIVLCDDKECLANSTLYGVLLPFAAFHLGKVMFRSTYDRFMSLFDDTGVDKQVDVARQEDAARSINLMRPMAERIRREETAKKGIVIVDARYGACAVGGSRAYPVAGDRTVDVTVPLQAMVNDSQLRIYSVKSQLPGFYDPCPGEAKVLHIRYTFHDEPHAVTVNDEMPVTIPMKAHRLTQRASTSE